jgi:hypothetical protein
VAWGGVPPVWLLLRHTVCAPVPGCVWVHLLRASLSALPALLCLSRILRVLRVRQGRGQRSAPRPTRTRAALVGRGGHVDLQTEGLARLVWARASRQRDRRE